MNYRKLNYRRPKSKFKSVGEFSVDKRKGNVNFITMVTSEKMCTIFGIRLHIEDWPIYKEGLDGINRELTNDPTLLLTYILSYPKMLIDNNGQIVSRTTSWSISLPTTKEPQKTNLSWKPSPLDYLTAFKLIKILWTCE